MEVADSDVVLVYGSFLSMAREHSWLPSQVRLRTRRSSFATLKGFLLRRVIQGPQHRERLRSPPLPGDHYNTN